MAWLNTNTLHNVLNIAIAFIAAAMVFDWSVLFTKEVAAGIIMALSTIKTVVNVVRDGLAGLIKPQPPVSP